MSSFISFLGLPAYGRFKRIVRWQWNIPHGISVFQDHIKILVQQYS